MSNPMKVGPKRIVALRYRMKNAQGDLLADIMDDDPVCFLHGSGEIIPGLESMLTGLRTGEQKSFTISPETAPDLTGTYSVDVIIDDIRPATDVELAAQELSLPVDHKDCGPGCCC
jgi:FKBP-type peptidyl-prolyl cis-trans isomerase SlyD